MESGNMNEHETSAPDASKDPPGLRIWVDHGERRLAHRLVEKLEDDYLC
jgi:hypothetical protein